MPLLRTAFHLLLAMVLVINGVVGVAMAASMPSRGMADAVDAVRASESLRGCHDSAAPASAHAGDDNAEAAGDCCADGRCACACVHHGTVVMMMLSPVAVVVAWPSVPALDVAAAPSAPVAPQLRPPIALIS